MTLKVNKQRTDQIAGDAGAVACAAIAAVPVVGAVMAPVCALDIAMLKGAYRRGYRVGLNHGLITQRGDAFIYKGGFCS